MLLVAVLPVVPGAQLGRDNPLFDPRYNDPAFESTMSIGRPDIAVTIPAICQFENSQRPAIDFVASPGRGRSQRQLTTKRCVRSKFDTPRFARLLSWLPNIGPESIPAAPMAPPEALSIDLA